MITSATAPHGGTRDDAQRPASRSTAALWAAFLPRLLARVVLLAVGGMLFWAVLPALFGWHATTVMSDSMAPRLLRGDIVVSLPVSGDQVAVGQLALVDDPDHPGRLRLHRVIKVGDGHILTTKGDANPSADSTPVQPTAVHGVAVLRVPYLAYPIVWLHEGDLGRLVLFGAGFAAVIALALPSAPGHPRPHGRRRRGAPHRPHPIVVAMVFAGALASVAASVATPAHAAFSSAAPTSASRLAAAATFDCFTAAPTNSAYFYYRYGETAGSSVADVSGNARTGTLVGGVTRAAGSCARGAAPAITLDGTSGYLTTSSSLWAPSTFTISTWFKTTSTAGGKLIGFGSAQSGASGSYDRHLYLSNDGRLNFGVYFLGYNTITSAKAYNDGAWHQVTATLSSAGMRLYVDGVQVAQNTSATSAEWSVGYWRVGYDSVAGWPNAPSSGYYNGSLSDTAVYATAFGAAQVAADYAAGR